MMRWRHVILYAAVLSAFGSMDIFANDYTLTVENQTVNTEHPEGSIPDVSDWLSSIPDGDTDFDQYQEVMSIMYPELNEEEDLLDDDQDVTSPPVTIKSSTDRTIENILTFNNVAPTSVYPSPDDSTISTTYLQYFKDMLVKLPYDTQYALFRVDDYKYRMVYGGAISLSGNVFSGDDLKYIRCYRTNNYSVWKLESGNEGSFKLTASDYLVCSSIGDLYPSTNGGVYVYTVYAYLFVLVLTLLFNLAHAFFFVGRYRIQK